MSLADMASAIGAVKTIGDSFEQLKTILEAGLAEQRAQTALLREQNQWLRQLLSAQAERREAA